MRSLREFTENMDAEIEDKGLLRTRQFAWIAILVGCLGIGTILVNAMFSYSLQGTKSAIGSLGLSGNGKSSDGAKGRDTSSGGGKKSIGNDDQSFSQEPIATPKIEPGVIPPTKSTGLKNEPAVASSLPESPAAFEKLLNEMLQLKPAEFRPSSAVLTWNGKTNLDQILPILKAKPEWRFEIGAHTPPSDTPEGDRQITERRAEAIAGYLGSEGISNIRMSTKGYGSSKPIADNSSELGRLRNQRIEIRVVSTQ
jgi:outer membrane protein OmpA-like peptidoglycan-associated protein